MRVSNRFSKGQKRVLVDIDETISTYEGERIYELAIPIEKNIAKINKLYDEGWEVIYWTARGSVSNIDSYEFTKKQLTGWGCKFHDVIVGYREDKPFAPTKMHFDMLIDDKAKRIEEL